MSDIRASCAGQWQLFDSRAPEDHDKARAICATCPMLLACRSTARTMKDADLVGTWAGKLHTSDHAPERIAEEDARWTDDQARGAHRLHAQGVSNGHVREGERVYQRRKKRQQHARARLQAVAS